VTENRYTAQAVLELAKHCATGAPPPVEGDLSEVITLLAGEVVRLSNDVSAAPPLDARTFIEAVSAMRFPKGWEYVAEEAERIRQLRSTGDVNND
jgi:hypothetical protein